MTGNADKRVFLLQLFLRIFNIRNIQNTAYHLHLPAAFVGYGSSLPIDGFKLSVYTHNSVFKRKCFFGIAGIADNSRNRIAVIGVTMIQQTFKTCFYSAGTIAKDTV